MLVYRIRHKETGRFHAGGQRLYDFLNAKNGKLYTTEAGLKTLIGKLIQNIENAEDYEVVTYELTEVESCELTDFG